MSHRGMSFMALSRKVLVLLRQPTAREARECFLSPFSSTVESLGQRGRKRCSQRERERKRKREREREREREELSGRHRERGREQRREERREGGRE